MQSIIALNGLSSFSLSMPRSLSHDTNFFSGSPLMPTKRMYGLYGCRGTNIGGSRKQRGCILVVEAKGKKGMPGKMYNQPRQPPPSIPKAEDDNPRFLLFIRSKKVPRWFPLSIISGGTTAKIMVAAKDTPIGKPLFESTMTRNIAGVVYKDEKEVRKIAFKQFPVLQAASELQYGYKLIDPANPNSALYPTDVIKIPPQEELKPVVEKVKDFFGNALSGVKESFGSISTLDVKSEEK